MTWQKQLEQQYINAVIACFNRPRSLGGDPLMPENDEAFLRQLIRFYRLCVVSGRESFLIHIPGDSPIVFHPMLVGHARYLIEFLHGKWIAPLRRHGKVVRPLITDAELRGEIRIV